MQSILGGLRRNLQRLARLGDIPESQVDVLAHMVLAAVNEAALHMPAPTNPTQRWPRARPPSTHCWTDC